MFKRSERAGGGTGRSVRLTVDGRPIDARDGDSVAAALLAAGVPSCRRTPVSGAPRAPYCLMGVCFDCLVEIDGVANRQGCLVTVQEGMAVRLQDGRRSVDAVVELPASFDGSAA